MKLNATSLILLIAAINALLFFFIALSKTWKEKSNPLFPLLLLLCTFIFLDEFTRWTPDFFNNYPAYAFFSTFAWFLVIPCIYKIVTSPLSEKQWHKKDILHLIPLIFILSFDKHAMFFSAEQKQELLNHHYIQIEAHYGKIVFGLQIIAYLSLIYHALSKHYKLQGFQLINKFRRWLKVSYALFLFYLTAIIVIISTYEITGIHLRSLDIGKTFILLLIIYGWLLYMINQPEALKHPIQSLPSWKNHFGFDKLSPRLHQIIIQIQSRQLFLDKELKGFELAQQLHLSPRQLTNLINQELGLTVPQLLNLLRIQELEKRFADYRYQNFSLMGLAEEVGFSSKSSLYRSFKYFTGETPSSYLKKRSQDASFMVN